MNKLDLSEFILMLKNILLIFFLVNSKNNFRTDLLSTLHSVLGFAVGGWGGVDYTAPTQ